MKTQRVMRVEDGQDLKFLKESSKWTLVACTEAAARNQFR